ncbi:MAG: hypothetical protein M3270_09055 [Thermoproteota archaeon]|nr:hypothetical protein [Thermoproteota archaeon]
MMMRDKTIVVIALLLAATLALVGEISVSITQHQAEAFGIASLPLGAFTSLPSSGGGSSSGQCVSGGSTSTSCNNVSVQTSSNTGNNAL